MSRLLAALLASSIAMPAAAEMTLSFYTGAQTAPHSRVTGADGAGTPFNFLAAWEGRSGEMPPYYGFRATWWRSESFGWGIDFNHAKVYADNATLTANGFTNLEFTDGLNIITANAYYRWKNKWAGGRLTPYVGGGVGIAVPHVDVTDPAGNVTFEYQYTGPAATWLAGLSYDFNDKWAVFGEYKGTYSMNEASLTGGGTLETDIITNAINIGLTYKF